MAIKSIDPFKIIPQELVVRAVDNQLYLHGLCLTDYGSDRLSRKRNWFHNPILVALILVTQLVKSVVNLAIDDDKMIVLNGDFARMFGIRVQFNIALFLFILMNLSPLLIWRHIKKHKNCANFLRVFQMLSGSIPPARLGLFDSMAINRLITKTRNFMYFSSINCKQVMPFIAFILTITPCVLKSSTLEVIVFGVPNAFFFALIGYHGFYILLLHGFYFYLICCYLDIKITEKNATILRLIQKPRGTNQTLFKSLYAIYDEIFDYNDSFWSKYLLTLWLTLGAINVILLFSSIYSDMILFFRIIFVYVLVMLTIFFSVILLGAAKINTQSITSYKLLNSLHVSICKSNELSYTYLKIPRKIKAKVI